MHVAARGLVMGLARAVRALHSQNDPEPLDPTMTLLCLIFVGVLIVGFCLAVVVAFARAVLYTNMLGELDGSHEIQRRLRQAGGVRSRDRGTCVETDATSGLRAEGAGRTECGQTRLEDAPAGRVPGHAGAGGELRKRSWPRIAGASR